jgi:hypothetical protein
MLDAQWLVKRASYMEFNVSILPCFSGLTVVYNLSKTTAFTYFLLLHQEVMKSTRTQLERELILEDVLAVKDLPSYTMLDK